MKRIAGLMVLVFALAGCVSTRTTPLSAAAGGALQDKSLALSRQTTQDFSAATPTKAVFGVIGAVAMISAGNQIVADNRIENPAIYIGAQLRGALESEYGLSTAAEPTIILEANTTDLKKIAASAPETDYLLDVQTVNWSILYRMNLSRYRVLYSVKVRLIDEHKGALLAEGFCYRRCEEDANPPTYHQMTANGAAQLKSRLHEDADACTEELKQKLLSAPL